MNTQILTLCLLDAMECRLKQLRSHGDYADLRSYVWGDTPAKAKTQCESLDYLFQLAVEMHKLGLPWI